VPGVRAFVRCGPLGRAPGGIMTYPVERIEEEIGYVAYYFHWGLDEILDLEHPDRQRYVARIAALNARVNEGR
jgi:hypothetical protein